MMPIQKLRMSTLIKHIIQIPIHKLKHSNVSSHIPGGKNIAKQNAIIIYHSRATITVILDNRNKNTSSYNSRACPI